ncbi:MAG: hypothetical protein Dbin4_02241 [Alphaproteobacteria bacterium]|nr:hypothetical protein [Alphaproteobacteria bacterium]
MASFTSNGLKIAFNAVGYGDPVLLLHGFAANRGQAWRASGWFDLLDKAGIDYAAMDHRGHGESDKPHEVDAYAIDLMLSDIINFLDYLKAKQAVIVAHSMGAMLTMRLLTDYPDRFKSAVLCGVGARMLEKRDDRKTMAEGLTSADPKSVKDEHALSFRAFAESTGSDMQALAACIRARREPIDEQALSKIAVPVMVITGSDDDLSGKPEPLAALIPGAKAVTVEGASHHTIMGDPDFKQEVVKFLGLRVKPTAFLDDDEEDRWKR